jgi:anti-sigma factor RsiW
MTLEQTHDTIAELLAVYALDAVEPDERDLVEDHLSRCSLCRAEVEEHRQVAAMLAGEAVEPPPHVWQGLIGKINATEPHEDLAPVVSISSKRKPFFSSNRWAVGVAAAAVIGLSAGVIVQSQRIGDLTSQITEQDRQITALAATLDKDPLQQAVTAALADPAAQVANLTAEGSTQSMQVVLLPDGTGYVYQSNLEALPNDATYQLWAVVDDKVISAGVLGGQPALVPFHLDPQGLQGLVITQEVAGGVAQSEANPVVAWFKA